MGLAPHFIPYVNGPELLAEALKSVEDMRDELIVVDNRDTFTLQPDPSDVIPFKVQVWKPEITLNHSQLLTWLTIEMKKADFPWFTWMHHDCSAGDSVRKLRELAGSITRQWGVILTKGSTEQWNHVDVLSAVNVGAVLDVGGWDWVRFPDYYSDYDLYGKLVKRGYEVIQSHLPVVHMNGGSTTVSHDGNRGLVKSIMMESGGAYQRLWEARKAELGLQWPPA